MRMRSTYTGLNYLIVRALDRLYPFGYFTKFSVIRSLVDKSTKSLLDVGCGDGFPTRMITGSKRLLRVGVDVFLPSLLVCKKQGVYDDCVAGDVRQLPFREQVFDSVISLEVIEHMRKSDGLEFIQGLARVSRKQVIISTPLGYLPQDEHQVALNIYQRHLSGWYPRDFNASGFEVIRCVGLRAHYVFRGVRGRKGAFEIRKVLAVLLDFVGGWVSSIVPQIAHTIVCVGATKRVSISVQDRA